MASVDQLDQTLRSIIASQRLGQPVFVRCLIQGSAIGNVLDQLLVEATGLISGWLNQTVQCLHAVGSSLSGELIMSLRFDQGATALISHHHCARQEEDLDFMLLGSRGAAYCQGSFGNSRREESSFFPTSESFPPELTPLVGALQRSLASGQPECVLAEPRS